MRINKTWVNRIILLSSVLFLLLLWQLGSGWVASPFLLPAPEIVIRDLFTLFFSPEFYENLVATILRGLAGALLSLIAAVIIGVLVGLWEPVRYAFLPVLVTVRSTPVISLILLALIWFGSENVAIFIAFLTMFPLLTTAILDGIQSIDRDLIEMAESFKVSRIRILRGIFIPGISPFFFNGASNAMGFGWRAVIIGEVLSQPWMGIGSRMRDAQNYLKVSELIAWTIIAIGVGSLMEYIIRKIEKKSLVWKNP